MIINENSAKRLLKKLLYFSSGESIAKYVTIGDG